MTATMSRMRSRPGNDDLDVDEPHQDSVGPPAAEAGEEPDGDAEGAGEGDHRDADDERGARAVDQAREDVATELVGAEEVGPLALRVCQTGGFSRPTTDCAAGS